MVSTEGEASVWCFALIFREAAFSRMASDPPVRPLPEQEA